MFYAGMMIFIGIHLATALARDARQALIDKLGALPFKGLFALISGLGLALIILGWANAPATQIYSSPEWFRHIAYLLMLFAMILVVSAYLPPGRIAAGAKHPMLAGVKLWAFAHLLVNGDIRSLVLFGGFLTFGVIDRIALKRRGAAVRQAGPVQNDIVAVSVGLTAYAAIVVFLHVYLSGMALR